MSALVTFGELYERALAVLHSLQELGARPGDKLILFLADNDQFIEAFWAAILGGIVPVPVAPASLTNIVSNSCASHASSEGRLFTPIAARSSAWKPSPRRTESKPRSMNC